MSAGSAHRYGPPVTDAWHQPLRHLRDLTVSGTRQHIMIYTARPGTEDADRLALITVLGTQALTG